MNPNEPPDPNQPQGPLPGQSFDPQNPQPAAPPQPAPQPQTPDQVPYSEQPVDPLTTNQVIQPPGAPVAPGDNVQPGVAGNTPVVMPQQPLGLPPNQANQQPMSQPVQQQYQQTPQTYQAPPSSGPNKKVIFALIGVALLLIIGAVVALVLSGGSSTSSGGDEKVRNDVGILLDSLENYAAANDGKILVVRPQEVATFAATYLPSEFEYAETQLPYELVTETPQTGEIQYIAGGICGADGSVSLSNNTTDQAVRALLSTGEFYCLDNSSS